MIEIILDNFLIAKSTSKKKKIEQIYKAYKNHYIPSANLISKLIGTKPSWKLTIIDNGSLIKDINIPFFNFSSSSAVLLADGSLMAKIKRVETTKVITNGINNCNVLLLIFWPMLLFPGV